MSSLVCGPAWGVRSHGLGTGVLRETCRWYGPAQSSFIQNLMEGERLGQAKVKGRPDHLTLLLHAVVVGV